ncbi:MAG TPA: YheC/YheD family protein, partial [Bacillota bacterium]|nr:YheC/YheD family protein [Bacillota bacterium]
MKPLIGVFVNNRFLLNSKGVLFASKLMQANEVAGCSVCFFSPEDIDWDRRKINATVFHYPSGRRERKLCPFPDIIYDRGTAFPKGLQREVEAIRRRFKNVEKIRFINSGKLEKWPVIERLRQIKAVLPYLPATLLCRHLDDIRRMLHRFGYIFIKNSAGSGGTAVLSVKKMGNKYHLFFFRNGAHHQQVFNSVNDLLSGLAGMLDFKNEKYIVQQGIRLVKYHGRPLDLRILLNKNKYGRWVAVYNQARVAPKGAVITNLALGGE